MERIPVFALALLALAVIVIGAVIVYHFADAELAERSHYARDETLLVVVNTTGARLTLFRAGKTLDDAAPVVDFSGEPIWLARGNYFLRADHADGIALYPVPIQGYRSGTERDDSFSVTVRPVPGPPPLPFGSKLIFVPSGSFLFGDRLNPREPHLVWTQGFFIGQFEVSNGEFRKFLAARDGYDDDSNWTQAGSEWRARSKGTSSARLSDDDVDFGRFGRDDHPVTQVNWFEAIAYCRWLTRTIGDGRWLYSLATEAEWEKAARGPDNFDYPLAQNLSDSETGLYNWRKNPGATVTVVGIRDTPERYRPNRFGIYHLGGNVVEWTQGLYRPFNREQPYAAEDGRNREDTSGVRVVRGGSWYSASSALMYIPYRDTFLPEVSHHDLGFRLVVRSLMH